MKQSFLSAALLLTMAILGCEPDSPGDTPPVTPPVPQAAVTPVQTPATPSAPDAKPGGADAAPKQVNDSGLIPAAERRELFLDLRFTDQDDQAVTLAEFVGKPTVITFIFTRCPRPDMCPRIVSMMADMQKRIAAANLADDVQMLLITYDPDYDTPERLKRYVGDRGVAFTNARALRPNLEDMAEILHELDVAIVPNTDGSIGHAIELMILDARGREAYWRRDTLWDNGRIIDHLQNLAAEQETQADQ